MLFRVSVVSLLLLALAGCEPYSQSNSGFSSVDKTVLYDFRNAPQPPSLPDSNTSQRVLAAVVPGQRSAGKNCGPAEASPKILGVSQGSFTGTGLKQTAYLVQAGECGREVATSSRRLAVFTGDQLAANVETPIGTAILGTYDLNRDGRNELLLEGDAGGRGAVERIKLARVVEFDKDKLAPVEEFGEVYDDACASSLTKKSIVARTIYYLPPPAGQKARFSVEIYRSPCPAAGQKPQWSRVTGG